MTDTPAEDGNDRLELRLTWELAESQVVTFADQMLLQQQGDFVVLTLGQAIVPALVGPDDPRFREVSERGIMSVRILARVAMTAGTAAKFGRAFQDLAERLKEVPDE